MPSIPMLVGYYFASIEKGGIMQAYGVHKELREHK